MKSRKIDTEMIHITKISSSWLIVNVYLLHFYFQNVVQYIFSRILIPLQQYFSFAIIEVVIEIVNLLFYRLLLVIKLVVFQAVYPQYANSV